MNNKLESKHVLCIPFLITLSAAILVATAFFLPMATANADYTAYLEKNAEEFNVEEIEMTNKIKNPAFFFF